MERFTSFTHRSTNIGCCMVYALLSSSMFVINLYLLVPKKISKLSREDPRQIKWRMFSVLATVAISVIFYPLIFYDDASPSQEKSLWVVLGLTCTSHRTLLPLFHVVILYLGPICTSILQYRLQYRIRTGGKGESGLYCMKKIISDSFSLNISQPLARNKWAMIRDIVIAPLAEELTFRSCIVTPFLYIEGFQGGKIPLVAISWCTPLFFGIAHLHHAIRRLKQGGNSVKMVILSSAFQFFYTTVFGAYATFSFIRTGSILGVILLHSFCNFMGLPSIRFLFLESNNFLSQSELTLFKFTCSAVYIVGILAFWRGFYSLQWII